MRNGDLLKRAQAEFDTFLTADSNLTFQQNLASFDIALVVLQPRSTRLLDVLPLMPKVLQVLKTIEPKDVVLVR